MMNDKRLTILIDGREALPVRAIPYVTGGQRFTPDRVASCLAQDKGCYLAPTLTLTAYHLPGNAPASMMPCEWNRFVAIIKGLEAKLKLQHVDKDIGYAAWLHEAVAKLPDGVWVWLDEFEKAFQVVCNYFDTDWTQSDDVEFKEPPEGKLILTPWLDATTRAMVMEGFDMPKAQTAAVEQAAPDAGLIPVQRQQDNAILKWLRDHKHDPKKLQRGEQGKPDVKKDCRDAVLFSSASVFNTAWDRLRANEEIQDAK